ncbi:MAG: Hsp20/alpha crystallin family protein [Bacteroidales bacterium]|nr:Hsp20/alpha crystallin family protein [Bacteroidales bacterium]
MTIVKRNINSPYFPDWLEDFFSGEVFNPLIKSRVSSVPMVNVFENDNSFRIEVAVPGMNKEDIKINIDNDIIKISAELESELENENEKCTKREYSYNSFSRSFTLPESADTEKIDAKSVDGVLKITIKKKQEDIVKPPRKIDIK